MSQLKELMDDLMDIKYPFEVEPLEEKKKMDPVGQEDGDVDNDGDEDESDEYIKNRRKKVSKEVEKDKEKDKEKDEVEEAVDEKHDPSNYNPKTHTQVGSKQKVKPNYNPKTHRLISKGGNVKVISRDQWKQQGAMLSKQGWGLAENRTMKFSTFRMDERTAGTNYAERSGTLPPKGLIPGLDPESPYPPEGMWDKESVKGLQFVAQHMKSDPKWEDAEDESHKDVVKAGRGGPGQTPSRKGDKLDNGDKSPAKETPSDRDADPIKMD